MDLVKMLFPKLMFGLDDQTSGGGAPDGQPPADNGNAKDQPGEPPAPSPTDFIELEGVKVPQSTFEKIAHERYKDAFEAQQNRDKWQAENTREAQRLKQLERDAESFKRLQSDPRFNQTFGQPQDNRQTHKQAYVSEMSKDFPDVDPRFFEKQFDHMLRIAGLQAKEIISPYAERQGAEWERSFLSSHPLLKPGTNQYDAVREKIENGYDPEEAYQIVFRKELQDQDFEARFKARDEERIKKLKANQTGSQTGEKPMTGTRSEKIWKALEGAGIQRE